MTKKDKDFVKELQTAQQQGNFKPSQIKKSRSAEDLTPKSQTTPEIKELQAQITALLEQISWIKQEANQQIQFFNVIVIKLSHFFNGNSIIR